MPDKNLRDILNITRIERERILAEVERRQRRAEEDAVAPANARRTEDVFTGQALGLRALGRWLRGRR